MPPPLCRPEDYIPPRLTEAQKTKLQDQMWAIFNALTTYVDPESHRRLATIFMSKPVKRLYPDYYVIIQHPLAFDHVRRRIQKCNYYELREYLFDVHLIFANARVYNQEGSVIFNDSWKLEKLALKMYKEFMTEEKDDGVEPIKSGYPEEKEKGVLDFKEFDQKFGLVRKKLPSEIAAEELKKKAAEAAAATEKEEVKKE
ncbi:unnamed protein product [Ambrosiozyma monospora]|uniref:Unnamed protein product n=1 Tax=Ambrosiozyma monospora TaxID=43982 RepID=A0ACB5T4P7_AMBMO|nr:unnamed protein product [Ambrosiozyma monospora]